MELHELEELEELNELDLLFKMIDLAENSARDAEIIIKGKRFKAAVGRVREEMKDVKLLADLIREKVQLRKNIPVARPKKSVLDVAINKKKQSMLRDEALYQKRLTQLRNNG